MIMIEFVMICDRPAHRHPSKCFAVEDSMGEGGTGSLSPGPHTLHWGPTFKLEGGGRLQVSLSLTVTDVEARETGLVLTGYEYWTNVRYFGVGQNFIVRWTT